MKTPLKLVLAVLLASLASGAGAWADDRNDDDRDRQSPEGFLGVGLEQLHPALNSHLGESLRGGRGVLIADVAEGSPADKAGLRPHDIVVSFDDQKIYSPEQLAKLVQNDRPGREIMLGIVRNGKLQEMKIKLSRRMGHMANGPQTFGQPMGDQQEQRFRPQSRNDRDNEWLSFDSMTLTRTDGKKFKAEIKYRDKDGKVDTRSFEGTRDELRKDVQSQKDLPADEREDLLRALDLSSNDTGFAFPAFGDGLLINFD